VELKLPNSQKTATGSYPEQIQSSPYIDTIYKIYFNIILPFSSTSPKQSVPFQNFEQNFVLISL